jgi:hypothetical protein
MGQHTTDRLAPVVSLAERRAARDRVTEDDLDAVIAHAAAQDVGDEAADLVALLTEAVPADPLARAGLLARVTQRLSEETTLRMMAWGEDPDSALRTEATIDSLLARALLIRGRA